MQLEITRPQSYCGGKNNKVEMPKKISGGLDFVYVPTWKSFDSLEFLKDNLEAHPTKTNLEDDGSSLNNPSIYNSDNPHSTEFVRKMVKVEKSNSEKLMATTFKAFAKVSSKYNISLEKKGKVDKNSNLIEMIYTMLQPIPYNISTYAKARIATKGYSSKI